MIDPRTARSRSMNVRTISQAPVSDTASWAFHSSSVSWWAGLSTT